MNTDWQTLAAGGIVAITLVIFLLKAARPKKKSGCGSNCGCDKSTHP